jgi:hypothetical protein
MKCVICKKDAGKFGNNAIPLAYGRCCDKCNLLVIAKRLEKLKRDTMEVK